MRPIIGAYHVGLLPGWVSIVKAGARRLRRSGLLDRTLRILVGTVGDPDEDTSLLTDFFGPRAVVRHLGELTLFEFPTLQWLYEEAQSDSFACWYGHTKGNFTVSDDQTRRRMRMESVVFDQYEKCLDALETHDMCGATWQLDGFWKRNPHYSGNYWWANASYLRTLPSPMSLRFGRYGRIEVEFWLGKNSEIRACNLEAPPQPFDRWSAWDGLESKYRDLIGNIGPVRRIVDLGVGHGFSTFQFALHFPDVEVIGVDHFLMYEDSEAWVFQHVDLFPNVRIIKGSTVEVGKTFGASSVDLLHIDADHEYESVAADFSAWLHAVRPGGCVLFHDTVAFPGVSRFFRELEGDKSEIPEHCGLGCWIKP